MIYGVLVMFYDDFNVENYNVGKMCVNVYFDTQLLEGLSRSNKNISIGVTLQHNSDRPRVASSMEFIYNFFKNDLDITLDNFIHTVNIYSVYSTERNPRRGIAKIAKKNIYENSIYETVTLLLGIPDIRYARIGIVRCLAKYFFNPAIIKRYIKKYKESNDYTRVLKKIMVDYIADYQFANKTLGFEFNRNVDQKTMKLYRKIDSIRKGSRDFKNIYSLLEYLRWNPQLIKDFIKKSKYNKN